MKTCTVYIYIFDVIQYVPGITKVRDLTPSRKQKKTKSEGSNPNLIDER